MRRRNVGQAERDPLSGADNNQQDAPPSPNPPVPPVVVAVPAWVMPWTSYVLLTTVLALIVVLIATGLHEVPEGFIGVYWLGGALLPTVTQPGYHWKSILTAHQNVQVTMQTDQVLNIPCGTSGGAMLNFDKIEVVNRLKPELVYDTVRNYTVHYDRTWIYDKIHHEINQFCSKHTLQDVYIDKFDQLDENLARSLQLVCDIWAPGIEIIAIRVTKPRIPDIILRNYEEMESEKTKLLVATQKQKVIKKQAETEQKRAVMEAEKQAQVAIIDTNKNVAEQEAKKLMEEIENEMHLAREKAKADAEYYKSAQETISNRVLLSDSYLKSQFLLSLVNNIDIVIGDQVPNSLLTADNKFTSTMLDNEDNNSDNK